jgi:hypothetical protein
MSIKDDLLISADINNLYWVIGELAKKAKEDNDLIKVLLQLEQFVETHKTRTRDMVTYRDTIERARNEYRSLKLKYDVTVETLNLKTKILNQIMNEKMDEDVNNEF